MLVWRKANIKIELSLCYSVVYHYTIMAVLTGQLNGLGFDLAWFNSVSYYDQLNPTLK